MALTATAVPHVREDVVKSLHLKAHYVTISSVDRANLSLNVVLKSTLGAGLTSQLGLVVKICKECSGDSTIVYATTTAMVESIAGHLRDHGVLVGMCVNLSKL